MSRSRICLFLACALLACALPVVTSTRSGAAELVTENAAGFVCDARDVGDVALWVAQRLDKNGLGLGVDQFRIEMKRPARRDIEHRHAIGKRERRRPLREHLDGSAAFDQVALLDGEGVGGFGDVLAGVDGRGGSRPFEARRPRRPAPCPGRPVPHWR